MERTNSNFREFLLLFAVHHVFYNNNNGQQTLNKCHSHFANHTKKCTCYEFPLTLTVFIVIMATMPSYTVNILQNIGLCAVWVHKTK